MTGYPISEVSKLVGVKQHVLRYWEKEIPLLCPRKDHNGRRVYSSADLEMLYRLQHLLYVQGFTIAGARKKIWDERTGKTQDKKAMITSIKSDLLRLAEMSENLRAAMANITKLDK